MRPLSEAHLREQMVLHGQSLHQRGFVPGSSGNISAQVEDGILVTPTNVCLGRLDPARISKLAPDGTHINGDAPSKEGFLHALMYQHRPGTKAVVHLHSTHAVAVSCCKGLSEQQPIPPLTPYFVMKVGKLRLLPYFPPGDPELALAVAAVADRHRAVLLANHGPIVAGRDLDGAVYAIEELEEAARLFLMLDSRPTNTLSEAQVADLAERFPS